MYGYAIHVATWVYVIWGNIMNHYKIVTFNCASAWYDAISTIRKQGDYFKVDCGSEETLTQKLNLTIEINHPEFRPLVDDSSPTDINFVNEYALRYLWLSQKEALDDSDYTYSGRLRKPVDQIQGVIDKYVKHLNDRQATMVTRIPSDIDHINPPCLSVIDTEILDSHMHLTCYFRSWDAFGGLPSNIAGLQLFNEALVSEINDRIGTGQLHTGKLILHSKNCHIYERNFNMVDAILTKKK